MRYMRYFLPFSFLLVFSLLTPLAFGADGLVDAAMVLVLPNPEVTPGWRTFAPPECQANPDKCASDSHELLALWDLRNFSSTIDSAFLKIAMAGYKRLVPIIPLSDTQIFKDNITLLYQYAAKYGLAFEPAVFPKYQFGSEWCYLYSRNAPEECPVADGMPGRANANVKMIELLDHIQNLEVGNPCVNGSYRRKVAIWYGWKGPTFPMSILDDFRHNLPTTPCNHQAAYTLWLDIPFIAKVPDLAKVPEEVREFQLHVINVHNQEQRVITEYYSLEDLAWGDYRKLYEPHQTLVTGFWGAASTVDWARELCQKWRDELFAPSNLIVWNYFDRDVADPEYYRALIGGTLAYITTICQP